MVLSLSSETRMSFKEAELKPVIAAQNKPVVFYSYTLPSDFARRELAKSGVVVLSGLTHAGVAMRRLLGVFAGSGWRRRRTLRACRRAIFPRI